MAASQRYTGANYLITFGGTTISNDYTVMTVGATMKTVDRTAGADTDESFNTTTKGGKADLTLFDLGENGTAIAIALRIGTTATLAVYSKGNVSGKPVVSFPAIVTDYTQDGGYDKNIEIKVAFLKNGAMINDFGATA